MAKGHLIIGLDIGSGTIKALAAFKPKKEENLKVLAFCEERSSGIRKGVVISPGEAADVIRAVKEKIGQDLKYRVDSVYVNVGGGHIFSAGSRGLVSVSRADQKISAEDVERVLQAAQTLPLPSNREVLEVLPREFIIDGERGAKEVMGMRGVRLEAEVLVLGGFAPYLKNLTTAVLNSGLQINDLVISPMSGSRAVLTPREKELGVAFLDIGAGTTGISVFEEGDLVHLAVLPIGSGHITNDIAIGLKTDIDVAEKVKLEFGTLSFQGGDKKEKIKLADGETLIFSQKQLSRIIEARVAEIFREANKELKKSARQGMLPAGIVLAGGGAKLPKIREFAKKEFRLPCRLGRPQGFTPEQDDPRLSTVCGLALRGFDLETEKAGVGGDFSSSGRGIGSKIKKIFKIFLP
jgi:cell division protein FtsA